MWMMQSTLIRCGSVVLVALGCTFLLIELLYPAANPDKNMLCFIVD